MRLPLIMASAIALSLAAIAGSSHADQDSRLFQVSTTVSCLEDTAGFDASLQPNPLPASPPAGTTNFIRQSEGTNFGVLTFNLDGTFTSQGTSSTIQATTMSLGDNTTSCSGTFVVTPSLSVTTVSSCTFTETLPPGNSGTITGIQRVYQATPGAQILMVSAPHPPVVETVHVTRPGGNSFTYQRVCTVAGSAGHLN